MVKKYKLIKSDYTDKLKHSGGYPLAVPIIPINTIPTQIQIANPVLPTINPQINVYPKLYNLGPKINLIPKKNIVNNCPKLIKNNCLPKITLSQECPKKKCDLNLFDSLINSKNKLTSLTLSPLSDDLPSLSEFL